MGVNNYSQEHQLWDIFEVSGTTAVGGVWDLSIGDHMYINIYIYMYTCAICRRGL